MMYRLSNVVCGDVLTFVQGCLASTITLFFFVETAS